MTALADQAAFVTGGGSGIGLACAMALAADGASVTIAGRTEAKLEAAAAELEAVAAPGASVGYAVCDVTSEDSVARAVTASTEHTGRLELCVAAAGKGSMGPVVAMGESEWRDVLDTNLTGAFFTLKHTAAAMVRAGGGSFVGISSIAAPLTHRHMSAYCVSKAGLESLLKTAADELGLAGVRVNGIRPGLVPTDLASPLEADPAVRDDYLAQMPLRRLGRVDDVAAAARYLLGPESAWVTGTVLDVDGGHHLRRGPALDAWARALFGDDAVEGRV